MANYLTTHYKGKWRILPEIDKTTNDFPRDIDGTYDEDEVYISCYNGTKVYYYGLNDSRRAVLLAYIPSIGRGRNIKNELKKKKIEIFNYDESSDEVAFCFLASDVEEVMELLKPKTSGASISPFSSKNRPKSDVVIPEEEMNKYKAVTSKVGKGEALLIKNLNNSFMSDVLAKKLKPKNAKKPFDYSSDMRQLKMSRQTKEYIFVKNMWEDYLKYLDEEIQKYYNNK